MKNQRSAVGRILGSGQLTAANQAELDKYFRTYGLARLANPAYVHEIGKSRVELKNALRSCGKSGKPLAVHDYMIDQCQRFFGNIAKGNYHPASRYNAMLMIGDLNSTEQSTGQTTVPLAAALPILLNTLADANQIDAVRLAALIGIRRHCELGIADANIRDTQVYPAMQTLAAATAPEGNRTPGGHAWMRVLAIQALVSLDGLGPNAEVLDTLGAAATEEEGLMLSRCAAAKAFGEFSYADAAGLSLDPMPSLRSLGQLAQAICEGELTLLEEMKRQEEIDEKTSKGMSGGMGGFMGGTGGMGGMGGMDGSMGMEGSGGMFPGGDTDGGFEDMGMGGMDDMMGMGGYGEASSKSTLTDAEQLRIDISKRRAWSHLRNVRFGLEGIKPTDNLTGLKLIAVAPDQLTILEELLAPIVALYAELDKKEDDEEPLDSKSLEKAYKTASSAIGEVLAKIDEATGVAAPASP